jgi:hypothetical protein
MADRSNPVKLPTLKGVTLTDRLREAVSAYQLAHKKQQPIDARDSEKFLGELHREVKRGSPQEQALWYLDASVSEAKGWNFKKASDLAQEALALAETPEPHKDALKDLQSNIAEFLRGTDASRSAGGAKNKKLFLLEQAIHRAELRNILDRHGEIAEPLQRLKGSVQAVRSGSTHYSLIPHRFEQSGKEIMAATKPKATKAKSTKASKPKATKPKASKTKTTDASSLYLVAEAAKQWLGGSLTKRRQLERRRDVMLAAIETTTPSKAERAAWDDLRDGWHALPRNADLAEMRFRNALAWLNIEAPPHDYLPPEPKPRARKKAKPKAKPEPEPKPEPRRRAKPQIRTAQRARGAGSILSPRTGRRAGGARPSLALAPAKVRGAALIDAQQIASTATPAKLRAELARQRRGLSDRARNFRAWLSAECKRGRARLAESRAAMRQKIAELRAHHAKERAAHAAHCAAERKKLAATLDATKAARSLLQTLERNHKRQLAEMNQKHSRTESQLRALEVARDKRSIELMGLERELEAYHPELLAYYQDRARKMKKKRGASLIETFLERAEGDPQGVAESLAKRERLAAPKLAAAWATAAPTYQAQHKRLESALCNRADRLFAAGKPMNWKRSELAAMAKLGLRPERIEADCYRAHAPWSPDTDFASWVEQW